MPKFLSFIILCFISLQSFAQAQDTIQIKRTGMGPVFIYEKEALRPRELSDLVKDNEAAFAEMKQARTTFAIGNVVAFAGGALIGHSLVPIMFGKDPHLLRAGIGAGLIGVALVIGTEYNRHATNAAKIFNSEKTFSDKTTKVSVGFIGEGVGISFHF